MWRSRDRLVEILAFLLLLLPLFLKKVSLKTASLEKISFVKAASLVVSIQK
jgi:hypothetical protein